MFQKIIDWLKIRFKTTCSICKSAPSECHIAFEFPYREKRYKISYHICLDCLQKRGGLSYFIANAEEDIKRKVDA